MNPRRPSWSARARDELTASLRLAAQRFPLPGDEGAHAVHEARKELKRAAALARLFAPIVGSPAYGALDVVNAARHAVARARDLDILPAVLESLKCDPASRDTLLRVIAIERGKARGAHSEIDMKGLTGNLADAAATVAGWDLGAEAVEPLLASLRLTYRSVKRRGRLAWASGDADDLHELRMRVVDLGHQIAVFEPAWPALLDAYAAELHRLRTSLGEHNDLTVLGEFALSRRELDAEAAEALVALVLRRRKPLERRAYEQFERCFAERPGAFERRIGAYLARPHKKL